METVDGLSWVVMGCHGLSCGVMECHGVVWIIKMLGEVVHLDGSHDSDVPWASMNALSASAALKVPAGDEANGKDWQLVTAPLDPLSGFYQHEPAEDWCAPTTHAH